MVSWTAWKAHANNSTVVGAESKFIEQQVPAFDSRFLFWFIEYVLAHWLEQFLQFQSDWGTDGVWCDAADGFAREVGWVDPKNLWFTSCALLANTRPFHHLNAHTLSSKAKNKRDFSSKGTIPQGVPVLGQRESDAGSQPTVRGIGSAPLLVDEFHMRF